MNGMPGPAAPAGPLEAGAPLHSDGFAAVESQPILQGRPTSIGDRGDVGRVARKHHVGVGAQLSPPSAPSSPSAAFIAVHAARQVSLQSTSTIDSNISSNAPNPIEVATDIPTFLHSHYAPGTQAYRRACEGRLTTGESVDFVLVSSMPTPVHHPHDVIALADGVLPDGRREEVSVRKLSEAEKARRRLSFEGQLVAQSNLVLERCVSECGLHVYTLVHIPLKSLKYKAHRARWPMRLSVAKSTQVLEEMFPNQHLVAHAHNHKTVGRYRASFVVETRDSNDTVTLHHSSWRIHGNPSTAVDGGEQNGPGKSFASDGGGVGRGSVGGGGGAGGGGDSGKSFASDDGDGGSTSSTSGSNSGAEDDAGLVIKHTLALYGMIEREAQRTVMRFFALAKETTLGPYVPLVEQLPHPWAANDQRPERRCFWPYDSRLRHVFEVTYSPEDPSHFPSSTRSLFVHDIMQRTKFLHSSAPEGLFHEHEVGIDWLLHHKVFEATFPLHDGHIHRPQDEPLESQRGVFGRACHAIWSCMMCRGAGFGALCVRIVWGSTGTEAQEDRTPGVRTELGKTWAQFWHKTRPQPLDDIFDYLGPRVAIYFLFLSHYTTALIWPSVWGFVAFLYGLAFFSVDPSNLGHRRPIVAQVCDSDLRLCGECTSCSTYELRDFCAAYEVGYIIDNNFTPIFAFGMALWSSAFLDMWERTRAMYVSYWALNEQTFKRTEHRRRPEFVGTRWRLNLLTGNMEQYMPDHLRRLRYLVSLAVTLAMLALVYCATLAYISSKLAITELIVAHVDNSEWWASLVAIALAATVYLVAIVLLNAVFKRVACALTAFENHETKYAHYWHLAAKMHVFSLISVNALCFYIAFVKVFVHAIPRDSRAVNEACAPYGCQLELAVQLAINMGGKQVIQDAAEMIFPLLERRWDRFWLQRSDKRKLARDKKREGYRRVHASSPRANDPVTAAPASPARSAPQPAAPRRTPRDAAPTDVRRGSTVCDTVDDDHRNGEALYDLGDNVSDDDKEADGTDICDDASCAPRDPSNSSRDDDADGKDGGSDGNGSGVLDDDDGTANGSTARCRLPWEEDFEDAAPEDELGLFDDFNELALQFSFCTFFVTALPIAPFLALLNNIFEIRVDAEKYLNVYRRVTPHYDTGISIWFGIFQILSFCGVMSTGFVMAFSSQEIPRIVHEYSHNGDFSTYVEEHFALYKPHNCSYPSTDDDDGQMTKLSLTILCVRLTFLILFENAVYVAKIALYESIPHIPHNVQLREELTEAVCQAVIADVAGVPIGADVAEGKHGELLIMPNNRKGKRRGCDDPGGAGGTGNTKRCSAAVGRLFDGRGSNNGRRAVAFDDNGSGGDRATLGHRAPARDESPVALEDWPDDESVFSEFAVVASPIESIADASRRRVDAGGDQRPAARPAARSVSVARWGTSEAEV